MLNYNLKNYTSRALQELFHQYTHLPIGGKEIVCPYWMNKIKKGIYGPLGGKGLPKDIAKITEEELKKDGHDLNNLSEEKIVSLMKEKKIGVDCSGFVFAMLDALDKEKGGDGIINDIPGCRGKLLCRANTKMLTADGITIPVEDINEIIVGDLIRLSGGEHVAIVSNVLRDEEAGTVKEITYAHSSRLTERKGVHEGKIVVTFPEKNLSEQTWEELTWKNENYGTKYFLKEKGDGIKRLKIWD